MALDTANGVSESRGLPAPPVPRPVAFALSALWWFAPPLAMFAQAQVDRGTSGSAELAAALLLVSAVVFALGYRQAAGESADPAESASDRAPVSRSRFAPLAPPLGAILVAASFLLFGEQGRGGPAVYLWAALWVGGPLLASAWQDWRVSAGTVAALASYAFFADNKVTLPGLALWLGGLLLVGAGNGALQAAGRRLWTRASGVARRGLTLSRYALGLIAIAAFAAALRLWQLERLPAELGPDLPINAMIAQGILRGEFPVFTPAHPGREALFFYFVALLGQVFGLTAVTTKVAGALVGVASVVAVYFAGKELFGREVGLWAALLLAVSKWALILSRTGLRFGLMPLFIAAFLWALSRALRTGRREYYYLLGLILGLGMYTYNAWYMVLPLAALLLVVQPLLWGRRPSGGQLALSATAFVVAFLVFVPEFRYMHDSPASFAFRVASRVTGQEAPLPADVIAVFLDNLVRALLMFNYVGDQVAINNVPFQRELGVFSGALFVLGVGYALARPRRSWHATLLVAVVAMVLPSALAVAFPNEVPSAGRSSGALVPAVLLAALPPALLRRRAWEAWRRREGTLRLSLAWGSSEARQARLPLAAVLPVFAALTLAGGVALETRETVVNYFGLYADSLKDRNWSISAALAETTDRFLDNGEVYVVYRPHWFDGNAYRVNMKSPPALVRERVHELTEPLAAGKPPLATFAGNALFVVKADDVESQRLLESAFPGAIKLTRHDFDGRPQYHEYYLRR